MTQKPGTKMCENYASLLQQAIRIAMEKGGHLTPEQVSAARTIAAKDQRYHVEHVPFEPGELHKLTKNVIREKE